MSPWRLGLIVALLAAYPLLLVGLMAFHRRHPSGVSQRYQWMVSATVAALYAVLGAHDLWTGASGRAALALALAILFGWVSLGKRRQLRLTSKS